MAPKGNRQGNLRRSVRIAGRSSESQDEANAQDQTGTQDQTSAQITRKRKKSGSPPSANKRGKTTAGTRKVTGRRPRQVPLEDSDEGDEDLEPVPEENETLEEAEEQPSLPADGQIEARWANTISAVKDRVKGGIDARIVTWIEDLRDRYRELREYDRDFHFVPPRFDGSTTAVSYYENLLERFLEQENDPGQRNTTLLGWERERARIAVADAAQLDEFDDRHQAMQQHVAAGGRPYAYYHESPSQPLLKDLEGEELALRLGFHGRDFGLDGFWNWSGTLGEGSYGLAGLWTQKDRHGRIIHRVVIKEINYSKDHNGSQTGNVWDDSLPWHGPKTDRVPNEGNLMLRLNALPNSGNILRCHGWRVSDVLKHVRIYLEYCQHGDLEQLILKYDRMRKLHEVDQDGNPLFLRIPIPLAWAVFESMTAALCLLHDGRGPWNPHPVQPLEPWHPILHKDIKPANIFLSKPEENLWKQIPNIKLADFGLASSSPDQRHDFFLPLGGTPGYQAPEQFLYDEDEDESDHLISTQADIWALGRVMLSLLNLQKASTVLPCRLDGNDDDDELQLDPDSVAFLDDAWNSYPGAMLGLVQRCLSYEPGERPRAAQLWDEVLAETGVGVGMGGLALRDVGDFYGEMGVAFGEGVVGLAL